ncbi:hypothetical protein PR048_031874 [Dryococelus australis]|uniref:Uncharacterized protein n=1 Tax=Dryococelus australis TaxID=614101 RepID=A0ABQ9G6I2_9NEOP|nr:hypothetical protein PR048_031874 [Dryococelus australis]
MEWGEASLARSGVRRAISADPQRAPQIPQWLENCLSGARYANHASGISPDSPGFKHVSGEVSGINEYLLVAGNGPEKKVFVMLNFKVSINFSNHVKTTVLEYEIKLQETMSCNVLQKRQHLSTTLQNMNLLLAPATALLNLLKITEEGEHGCAVLDRALSVLSLHEELAELARARPVLPRHHVDAVRVCRRSLPDQPVVCNTTHLASQHSLPRYPAHLHCLCDTTVNHLGITVGEFRKVISGEAGLATRGRGNEGGLSHYSLGGLVADISSSRTLGGGVRCATLSYGYTPPPSPANQSAPRHSSQTSEAGFTTARRVRTSPSRAIYNQTSYVRRTFIAAN